MQWVVVPYHWECHTRIRRWGCLALFRGPLGALPGTYIQSCGVRSSSPDDDRSLKSRRKLGVGVDLG
jgi:hypothetical protein